MNHLLLVSMVTLSRHCHLSTHTLIVTNPCTVHGLIPDEILMDEILRMITMTISQDVHLEGYPIIILLVVLPVKMLSNCPLQSASNKSPPLQRPSCFDPTRSSETASVCQSLRLTFPSCIHPSLPRSLCNILLHHPSHPPVILGITDKSAG